MQQAPRRVLLVAEKARVHQGQLQQSRLKLRYQALHRPQQARIVGYVVDHHGHHFEPERLIHPMRRAPQQIRRAQRCNTAAVGRGTTAFQALHHGIELAHLGQSIQRRRHGGPKGGRPGLWHPRRCQQ